QPVILVAADGRSANLRTYLFQPRSAKDRPGGLSGAMYLDQLVLEDGVWRLWSLSLNEPYFTSGEWKTGWAGMKDRPSTFGPAPGASAAVRPTPNPNRPY